MIKTGIDLVLNKRIEKNLSNPYFLKKVFHPSELKQAKNHGKTKLAGFFALKEALMKAIGRKINWLDIEITSKEGKKPKLTLKHTKFKSFDCSISHDGDYTIAIVVMEV